MRALRWSLRRPWVLWLLTLVLLVGAGVSFARNVTSHQDSTDQRQRTDLACIERWADAYTARAKFINMYLLPRNNALDRLEVAVLNRASDRTLTVLRADYLAASRGYSDAVAANPPIPTPRLLCAEQPEPAPTPTPTTSSTTPTVPTRTPSTRSPATSSSSRSTRSSSSRSSSGSPARASQRTTARGRAAAPRSSVPRGTAGAGQPRPSSSPSSTGLVDQITAATCRLHVAILCRSESS